MTNESPLWFKSSFSGNGGADCVEVAHNLVPTLGTVPVRDSKVPGGPTFAVSAAAFTAFVDSLKEQRPGA
ncbi:DUF397 domain-containing protein [Streptomyces sp. NK15101]|uniref:DUF397 domain-containing protein n=1 Tax=Streptomyces sp. NK15101 TaxID=2873261 RepID=UPI001CECA5ED|nr:DUF397 domain-containing protein [Streptomyces sp. NK15101]